MFTRKRGSLGMLIALALGSSAAFAQGPNLGMPITPAEIAAWDISILPDGSGLPPGSGSPAQGSAIFAAKCAACHGENAKGGQNAALVGGPPLTSGINATKTIANFWPYATTLFDFTRRAMPWPRPRTLTNRSEEHTSELQSQLDLVCRLLLRSEERREIGRAHV